MERLREVVSVLEFISHLFIAQTPIVQFDKYYSLSQTGHVDEPQTMDTNNRGPDGYARSGYGRSWMLSTIKVQQQSDAASRNP